MSRPTKNAYMHTYKTDILASLPEYKSYPITVKKGHPPVPK